MALYCPHCQNEVPLSLISDADLLSERGRRNAARRKTFGARPKGQRFIWKEHRDSTRMPCRCPDCLTRRFNRMEHAAEDRIRAGVKLQGIEPEWARQELQRVRRQRSEVDWVVLDRQLAAIGASERDLAITIR